MSKICKIEGCANPTKALGLCNSHYMRWWKSSDFMYARQRVEFCTVPDCGRRVKAQGWCAMHYARWKKHGDPMYLMIMRRGGCCELPECRQQVYARRLCRKHYTKQRLYGHANYAVPRLPAEERFWAMVHFPPCEEDCWLWLGSRTRTGYGRFWSGSKLTSAHRFSYETRRGFIPDGLVIDHLCKSPACVNPAHLEAVTQAENIRRGVWFVHGQQAATAARRARTQCRNGHPLIPDNTRYRFYI